MKNENKKQLILILVITSMVFFTLLNWYPQFKFHTFTKPDVTQYFMKAENEEFRIEGYEFLYNEKQYYGSGRIHVLKDNMILKNDKIELSFENNDIKYNHEIKVKKSDEIINIPMEDSKTVINQLEEGTLNIKITRSKKVIYEESLEFKIDPFVIYNGISKDYMIQDIYMTSSLLKTGTLHTNIKDLHKEYPYIEIDYIVSDNEAYDYNEDLRFIHLNGKTEEFLENENIYTEYYTEGSLLDKHVVCVVSLLKSEDDKEPFVFKLDLTESVKEVSYE